MQRDTKRYPFYRNPQEKEKGRPLMAPFPTFSCGLWHETQRDIKRFPLFTNLDAG